MGGFAAGIGGFGQAAGEYGREIRGLLEQRREGFAKLLTQVAENEPDPNRRAEYLHHAADLYGGKDMGKIVPSALKTFQAHIQSDQALSQVLPQGQPPAQNPTPTPPGQTPGTASAPAAQPSTSPVQPIAQGMPSVSQAPPAQGMQPIAPGMPTAQDPHQIYAKYSSLPEWSTPAGFARLKPLMDSEITHNEALRQQEEQLQFTLATKRAGLERMKSIPGLMENLLPFQRSGYEAEAAGMAPISTPGFAMMPRVLSTSTPGSAAPEGIKDAFGNPIKRTGGDRYRIETDMINGERWYPITPETTNLQTPGGIAAFNKLSGEKVADFSGAIPPAMNAPSIKGVNEQGNMGFMTPIQAQTGQKPVFTGLIPPSMVPTTTTSVRAIQTVGPDGNPMTTLEPVTSTRTKGTPSQRPAGTEAPQGAGRSFEKPLTPLQNLTEEQKYGQYNTAISRAQRVVSNIHLLDSLIDSGKMELALQSTPEGNLLRAIISRGVKLTPAESKMVTDFNSLRESVNLIRGPLGATGFRGPEAFSTLQAQRGNLLARPEITKGVLENFIQELQNQVKPIASKLHKGESTPGAAAPMKVTLPSGKQITIQ